MRISDWSSDVCSSDLPPTVPATVEQARELRYVDGVTPAFTQHLSFRWGGGVFPFRGGAEPKTQIYVRLREEVPVGKRQLLSLADSIPSPGLSWLTTRAQASSLTWTLDLPGSYSDASATGWGLLAARHSAPARSYKTHTA